MKNPNGFGSVYKLSGKRRKPWIARVTIGWDEEKQLYQTIGYFATKKEALDALVASRNNPIIPKKDITLGELYEEWSEIKYSKISDSSVYGYKAAWYNLEQHKNERFADLRTSHFQNAIDKLEEEGKSKSSMNMIKVLGGSMYKYAMQNDIVDKDYSSFAELPRIEKNKKERFTDLEIKKFEEIAKSEPYADTILILIYTGMRISEMLSLTKFNVDIKNMIITGGVKTEAGKDRIIPIHSKIQGYIKAWYDKGGDTLIFREDGKKIRPEYYRSDIYYPILYKYNMRRLTPHSCRHTFASLMSAAGVDPLHIQKIIGHADYSTTANIYTHPEIIELKNAIEKI